MGRRSLRKLVPPYGLVLVFLWFDSARGEAPLKPAPLTLSARPDETWDAVFDRRDGWTGGDVAGTVALGDGRMLWFFGDTWIGSIRGGRRVPGARMVNNSVAVHTLDPAAPWKAPAAASVRFYWGPGDPEGRPTAWAVPPKQAGGPRSNLEREEWLWPTGGAFVARSAAGARRLFVFFYRVARNADRKGVWGFSIVGTAIGAIDNLAEPPQRWKLTLSKIPHGLPAGASSRGPVDAQTSWGMSALVDPQDPPGESAHVLIYGRRSSGIGDNALLLARANALAIDQFEGWTFYAGNSTWVRDLSKSASLARGMVPEFSVEPVAIRQKPAWLIVQSEVWLGKHILVRTAPRPEGPWSRPMIVATVRDVERNASYFAYAAKGHVELSRPGELLVSYLVNSNQFSDLMRDTQIYRPKFLRISLSFLNSR